MYAIFLCVKLPRNVSLRIIERIAKALDVEIAELFQGTEYK